jgi:hypothetical protein
MIDETPERQQVRHFEASWLCVEFFGDLIPSWFEASLA